MFVFTVSFFLRHYGFGKVEVIARNSVEALSKAVGASEHSWMLLDSDCEVESIRRGFLAKCSHMNAYCPGNAKWECEDCPETWGLNAEEPMPSATRAGFAAYCALVGNDFSRIDAHDYGV